MVVPFDLDLSGTTPIFSSHAYWLVGMEGMNEKVECKSSFCFGNYACQISEGPVRILKLCWLKRKGHLWYRCRLALNCGCLLAQVKDGCYSSFSGTLYNSFSHSSHHVSSRSLFISLYVILLIYSLIYLTTIRLIFFRLFSSSYNPFSPFHPFVSSSRSSSTPLLRNDRTSFRWPTQEILIPFNIICSLIISTRHLVGHPDGRQ